MQWSVGFSGRAAGQYRKLPEKIRAIVDLLVVDIEVTGPVRGNWKNYGKLSITTHHCHLRVGRPTYVACWEVRDRVVRIVEVFYVGSHENAPY